MRGRNEERGQTRPLHRWRWIPLKLRYVSLCSTKLHYLPRKGGEGVAPAAAVSFFDAAAMITPIIQFGTSRFLQAHVDLFVSDARAAGQDAGPITVVQTTADVARAGRLAAFDGRPIPIVIRGLENGQPIERTEQTRSIVRGLSAAADWPEVERIFVEEARFAVSNTGESGYASGEETIGAGVPRAFPVKLTKLLLARWQKTRVPLTLLPCELVTSNGNVLRELCCGIAERSRLPTEFARWLATECVWASSLVDRIVSGALEPAGAVAEPYALWAIERQPRLTVPCIHPAIRLVDDLAVTERLKLFILNLATPASPSAGWSTGVRRGRPFANAWPTRQCAPSSTASTTAKSCRSSPPPGSGRRRPTGQACWSGS